ncbi:hypothetical protein, partial [Okeania sp. SIO1F9]|uniref:hypothetical protein n=1 Tax=Okeania sp. SIO1F9 TaxID=2607813 RepID=UPI00257ED240
YSNERWHALHTTNVLTCSIKFCYMTDIFDMRSQLSSSVVSQICFGLPYLTSEGLRSCLGFTPSNHADLQVL